MAEGGWGQERLDLEQWQQASMAILLGLGCGGEGARVWLNEASVLTSSGCPGQGLSWEMPPTPTTAWTLPFVFQTIPCAGPSAITGCPTVSLAGGLCHENVSSQRSPGTVLITTSPSTQPRA